MGSEPTTIYIVDDDASVGRSLARLMRSAGYAPEVFASVDEFLARPTFVEHGCVIADVQMRGGNGLQLQRRLKEHGSTMPVILLTAQDSTATRDEAKRSGFSAFFRKPVDDQALIDAIEWALNQTHS
jgi:FixJ family two-component response regulator